MSKASSDRIRALVSVSTRTQEEEPNSDWILQQGDFRLAFIETELQHMSEMLSFKHGVFDCKSEIGQERDCVYSVTPLKALFSSEDLLKVWLQASGPFSCQLEEQMLLPKTFPAVGRWDALEDTRRVAVVYACLRKLTVPDVVIHCFIFFRETVFLQKTRVFAEDASAFVQSSDGPKC